MTKRFLSVMAMVSVVAMMMLSSCTPAGVECGLIGTWEYSSNMYTETWEIGADDKFTQTIEDTNEYGAIYKVKYKGTIEKVSGKSLTIVYADSPTVEETLEYSDLTATSVKFGGDTFTKIN